MGMKLICPECGEPAEYARPVDLTPEVPSDRKLFRHVEGQNLLCPVVGPKGYIPALPTDKKRR